MPLLLMAQRRLSRTLPPATEGGGVAQGDGTFVLAFIPDGNQVTLVSLSGSDVTTGTFVLTGIATYAVRIHNLPVSSSRGLVGTGATITNQADSDSTSPYTVTAGGVLDFVINNTIENTTYTLS